MNPFDTRKLCILVNHPEPLLALGLATALRQQADFDVLMSGTDAACGHETHDDVVITDYRAGLGLAAEARRTRAAHRILVMTVFDREHDVRVALEAGVHGYLLLGCSIEELAAGVRTLSRGARYLCQTVAQSMADSLTREALTARETEVLYLVARGQCNKAIASQLEVTVGTVKAHVKAIMNKLDAGSRTEAVSIAAQRGLVDKPLVPLSLSVARLALQTSPAALYN